MNVRGYTIEARANLFGANLQDANLYGVELQYANLQYANLCSTNLATANLRGANLQGADISDADLWGADVRDTNLNLEQIICPVPDLSGLAQYLAGHVTSRNFAQGEWGDNKCGTVGCLAAAAAEYIGLSGNSGAGVIAIKEGLPGFDLDVLYQTEPAPAIDELARFVAIDRDEIPVD